MSYATPDNESVIHRYYAAAGLDTLPKDLSQLRYTPVDPMAMETRRALVDTMTAIWCSGTNDNQRKANVDAFSPNAEAQRTLRYYFADHQRISSENILKAAQQIGISEQPNRFLTRSEKNALDSVGYVNLGVLLNDKALELLRERLDARVETEGAKAGHEVSQTRGIARLSGTVIKTTNFDGLLDVFFSHPRLLAAVQHIIGKHFKLSSSNFHAPLPGYGAQAIHADWGWGVNRPEVANAIWMLDDFTTENGPTRVIPESHLSGIHPTGTPFNDGKRDPFEPIEGEIQLTGKAGTCVIYNAHLWHSGTQNRTTGIRRALHSFFTKVNRPPQTDAMSLIDGRVWGRFSATQRALLDIPSPD